MRQSKKSAQAANYPKWDWFLAAAVVVGIIARIFLIVTRQFAVSFDEAHNLRLAGSFLQNGIHGLLHPYWPPLYPAVTAIFSLVLKSLESAGRAVNILASAGVSIIIYTLTKKIFDRNTARISALFILFYPPIAYESTDVGTEPLYTLLGLAGVLLFYNAFLQKKRIFFFFAGVLWALSYLVRPEGVGFLIVAFGFLFLSALFRLTKDKKTTFVVWISITVFGFLIISSPYLIYLKKVTGVWTFSTKGMVNQQLEAAVEFNPKNIKDPFYHVTSDNKHLPADMAYLYGNIQDLTKFQEGRNRFVSISIREYAEKYAKNLNKVLKEAVPRVVTVILLIFATAGFLAQFYSRKKWHLIFYLSLNIVFFWFVVIPLFHVNPRYLIPLFPIFFIWISRGVIYLINWTEDAIEDVSEKDSIISKKKAVISKTTVISILILFCFILESGRIFAIKKYMPGLWGEPVEIKEAGIWLKNHTDHPPILLSINKAADFYAGQYDMKKGASFSYDSVSKILDYARYKQCEYVVFSSRYVVWFKNAYPFLSPDMMPEDIRLVYDRTDPDGVRAVVYKILYKKSIKEAE